MNVDLCVEELKKIIESLESSTAHNIHYFQMLHVIQARLGQVPNPDYHRMIGLCYQKILASVEPENLQRYNAARRSRVFRLQINAFTASDILRHLPSPHDDPIRRKIFDISIGQKLEIMRTLIQEPDLILEEENCKKFIDIFGKRPTDIPELLQKCNFYRCLLIENDKEKFMEFIREFCSKISKLEQIKFVSTVKVLFAALTRLADDLEMTEQAKQINELIVTLKAR